MDPRREDECPKGEKRCRWGPKNPYAGKNCVAKRDCGFCLPIPVPELKVNVPCWIWSNRLEWWSLNNVIFRFLPTDIKPITFFFNKTVSNLFWLNFELSWNSSDNQQLLFEDTNKTQIACVYSRLIIYYVTRSGHISVLLLIGITSWTESASQSSV